MAAQVTRGSRASRQGGVAQVLGIGLGALVGLVGLAAISPAFADEDPKIWLYDAAHAPEISELQEITLNERLWLRGTARSQTAMSEVIVDQLTELGNQLGYHLDVVSMELIALKFDGRRRRMHLGLGAGDRGYLSFRFDSDLHFVDGLARVTARIDLAIAGKTLELSLPEVELEPTSYRGERGVEVRLPLINRRF